MALSGQEAVVDVANRELHGGFEGCVGELDPVVSFVAIAQTLENVNGLIGRRRLDIDGLEAAFEGSVLLNMLAVLVECGRADALDFAPR